MTAYKDRINVVNHNFATTTITINNTIKAQGVHMIEVERNEDENEIFEVDDGTAIHVESNSRSGEIRLQILEASPTNDALQSLADQRISFPIGVADSHAPNLNCNGKYFRLKKRPVIVRQKAAQVIQWDFVTTYLNMKGGSYTLVTE